MNKDTAILVLTAVTLAELTLLVALAYRLYQKYEPTLQGATNTADTISSIINTITGTKPAGG